MIENQNTEFKKIWKDDYLKSICAFANAQGGTLWVGLNDISEITGISNYKKLLEDLPNKIRDILGVIVQINLHEKDQKHYLEIVVPKHNNPISFRGHFYCRSGSTIQELNGGALERFLLEKRGKKWDGVLAEGFTNTDLSQRAFDIFRQKAKRSQRIPLDDLQEDNEHLLELLGLTENGKLTRAAVLAFGKNPEKLNTGTYVKIGFFRSHGDLRYHDEIHGSLFEQVEKTMDLLLTKYMRANIAYEGITRTETYDYPEEALREAVLNAIIHKDYTSGSPIQISVYDKTIWISNTGNLPQSWTVETLKKHHKSIPPNPDIANAFFRAGYIEVWGRGTLNIIEYCKNAGLPEPDFHYEAGLTVLFKKENKSYEELARLDTEKTTGKMPNEFGKSSEENLRRIRKISNELGIRWSERLVEKIGGRLVEKVGGKLVESQWKIILLMEENSGITKAELSEILKISTTAIDKSITKLKKLNIIKRIGPDKGGYWEVMDNE